MTPVMEGAEARGRRVSFSPDVDDSYRMNVIDKIKGLMDEVDLIHRKEQRQMTKTQEGDKWNFRQKQEKELQDFLNKQKQESQKFEGFQSEARDNLKERQQGETLRLFGTTSTSSRGWNGEGGWNDGNSEQSNQRTTVMDYWNQN